MTIDEQVREAAREVAEAFRVPLTRVEAVVEVREAPLVARLEEILRVDLDDDVLAWSLDPHGAWRRVERRVGIDAHQTLLELARLRAGETLTGESEPSLS